MFLTKIEFICKYYKIRHLQFSNSNVHLSFLVTQFGASKNHFFKFELSIYDFYILLKIIDELHNYIFEFQVFTILKKIENLNV